MRILEHFWPKIGLSKQSKILFSLAMDPTFFVKMAVNDAVNLGDYFFGPKMGCERDTNIANKQFLAIFQFSKIFTITNNLEF